jgi:hypothetical protein
LLLYQKNYMSDIEDYYKAEEEEEEEMTSNK